MSVVGGCGWWVWLLGVDDGCQCFLVVDGGGLGCGCGW